MCDRIMMCYGNNSIGYSGWTAGYNGCYAAEFYVPSSNGNRTKIACYDMKLSKANITLNACDLCQLGAYGYDCVKQWAVDCGQWWAPNKLNSAGHCHDVENMLINAFVNGGRDCESDTNAHPH